MLDLTNVSYLFRLQRFYLCIYCFHSPGLLKHTLYVIYIYLLRIYWYRKRKKTGGQFFRTLLLFYVICILWPHNFMLSFHPWCFSVYEIQLQARRRFKQNGKTLSCFDIRGKVSIFTASFISCLLPFLTLSYKVYSALPS